MSALPRSTSRTPRQKRRFRSLCHMQQDSTHRAEKLAMDPLSLSHLSLPIRADFLDVRLLQRFLNRYPILPQPHIVDFQPWSGHAGTLMVIVGRGFSKVRSDNLVVISGVPCTVILAEEYRLIVITSQDTQSGSVGVVLRNAPDRVLRGPRPFYALNTPAGNLGFDGPPMVKEGIGKGWLSYNHTGAQYLKQTDDQLPDDGPTYPVPTQEELVTSNGQPFRANLFVLPVYPSDSPVPTAADRQTVIDTFNTAAKYYTQATYGVWSFTPRVLDWAPLEKDNTYYHDAHPDEERIRDSAAYELIWEALTANHDTLSSPEVKQLTVHMYCVVYFANGAFLRGANYGQMESLTITKGLRPTTWRFTNIPGFMYVSETATWGQVAHEIGHTMVRTDVKALVNDEDMYSSDLLDPNEATAESFEMMGAHDEGPLFSSYLMLQRGWYQAWNPAAPGALPELLRTNVRTLTWKADPLAPPFSKEYNLVGHGEVPNKLPGHWHILRIRIAEGLDYFVEVRERPSPGSSSIFDENVPVPSGRAGGVVVTRVLYGQRPLNVNQQTRTIVLLHGQHRVRALVDGEQVDDPARGIKIIVVSTSASSNPLVCRVRVDWNQAPPTDNPAPTMDLFISPWNDDFNGPDVWINRWLNNGQTEPNPGWPPIVPVDKGETPIVPRAGSPQRYDFVARIRNAGTADALNVQVAHYVNSPPAIGDNGSWMAVQAAQDSHNIGTVPAGGESYSIVTWKPTIASHTCLQVQIVAQTGERTSSNNFAQQNIFKFDSEAASPGQLVEMVVSVRNPQPRKTLVRIEVDGVREGFLVYFPHRWVWLKALEEKQYSLLVVPTRDIKEMARPGTRRTKVRVMGFISREYINKQVPSWWSSIGGVTMEVTCKFKAKAVLEEKPVMDVRGVLKVRGHVEPRHGQQHILMTAEKTLGKVESEYTTTDDLGEFSVEWWYERLKDEQGMVVSFQATIVDSEVFMPAESNIVHWNNF